MHQASSLAEAVRYDLSKIQLINHGVDLRTTLRNVGTTRDRADEGG